MSKGYSKKKRRSINRRKRHFSHEKTPSLIKDPAKMELEVTKNTLMSSIKALVPKKYHQLIPALIEGLDKILLDQKDVKLPLRARILKFILGSALGKYIMKKFENNPGALVNLLVKFGII